MKWFAAAVAAVAAFVIVAIVSVLLLSPFGGIIFRWGGSGSDVVDTILFMSAIVVFGLFGQFAFPVLCAIAAYKYFAKKERAGESERPEQPWRSELQ